MAFQWLSRFPRFDSIDLKSQPRQTLAVMFWPRVSRLQRAVLTLTAVVLACVLSFLIMYPEYPQHQPYILAQLFPYACVDRGNGPHDTSSPTSDPWNWDSFPVWQRRQQSQGVMGFPVAISKSVKDERDTAAIIKALTSDNWPQLSKNYYRAPIPRSPYSPGFIIRWQYNVSQLLRRADVAQQPPKIITWMKKPRHIPYIPESVRLRVCPEMPCRMTTNADFRDESAALLWSGEHMDESKPPPRSSPDQVFVFHDLEPPGISWFCSATFRLNAWKAAFNWTMHYRFDADILSLHGLIVKRSRPPKRNYSQILARKTKLVAWIVSHKDVQSRRDEYVWELQKYIPVDVLGENERVNCPRDIDDVCFEMVSKEYKFYLAFENSFLKDYITEKFFRYLGTDAVVVARGSNEYRYHAPLEIFINTADFKTVKELADHLLYLDKNPEEYLKILKAKDEYDVLYEDYPLRTSDGQVTYMHYQYEATAFCEMCRRLWNLDSYRQTIPDISKWVDKEIFYPPTDV